jgi:hypothetical protein
MLLASSRVEDECRSCAHYVRPRRMPAELMGTPTPATARFVARLKSGSSTIRARVLPRSARRHTRDAIDIRPRESRDRAPA